MKPFPPTIAAAAGVRGGASGLNISLHLILLSLALIAGFYLIFRELRRVEYDLHDAITRSAHSSAPPAPFHFDQGINLSQQQQARPQSSGVVLYDVVVEDDKNATAAPIINVPASLPPVKEEDELAAVAIVAGEANEAVGANGANGAASDSDSDEDGDENVNLASLTEDELVARPATALRDYLRRHDASTTGNKHELAKRILAEKKV